MKTQEVPTAVSLTPLQSKIVDNILDGNTQTTTAKILGKEVSTVSNSLSQAYKKVRTAILEDTGVQVEVNSITFITYLLRHGIKELPEAQQR